MGPTRRGCSSLSPANSRAQLVSSRKDRSLPDSTAQQLLPIDLAGLPLEALGEWLSTMVLIREFEESLDPLSIAGKIPGGVHLASGQEAVAVGASRALADTDVVTTAHRPHHHALANRLPPERVMAELWGR